MGQSSPFPCIPMVKVILSYTKTIQEGIFLSMVYVDLSKEIFMHIYQSFGLGASFKVTVSLYNLTLADFNKATNLLKASYLEVFVSLFVSLWMCGFRSL